MKKNTLTIACCLLGFSLFAQSKQSVPSTSLPPHRTCGTDALYEEQMKNPLLKAGYDMAVQQMLAERNNPSPKSGPKSAGVSVTIPVVVHVLWKPGVTNSINVSVAQINSQINRLNTDYRRLNPDISNVRSIFLGDTADLRVEFCLAQTDPLGDTTTGIIVKQVTTSMFATTATSEPMKYTSLGGDDAWDRSKYLNIWVCNFSHMGNTNVLGYAQFPGGAAATDGVVIRGDAFGDGGTAVAPYNKGRTGVHEVGHWLGLYHPFQGGCTGMTSSTCSTQGDLCCDTPPVAAANYGCSNGNANSCAETYLGNRVDMWENFMDYSDDACSYMFSRDQKSIVTSVLNSSRASLKTSLACALPGSVPIAAYSYTPTTAVCIGDTITFTDASTVTTPSTYLWNFGNGAIPATANTVGPHKVVYTTAGSKAVSYTTGNGTYSTSVNHYITVVPPPTPALTGPQATCQSSSASYSVSSTSGSTYTFSAIGGTIGSTTANSAVVNWGTGSTGQVIVNELNSAGCHGYDTVTVTLTNGISTVISGPLTACTGVGQHWSVPAISGSAYTWTIAGGTVSSGGGTNNPLITFTIAGTKNIIVNQSIGSGCSALDTFTVTVYQTPTPTITGPTNVCVGNSYNYSTSSVTGSTYNWTISAGGSINTGAGTNAITATWPNGAISTMNLQQTVNGCLGTTSLTIASHSLPATSFTYANNNGSVNFTNTSPGGGANSYTWYFGDGSSLSGQNVSHTYASAGMYTVCLEAIDNYNCTDSSCHKVDITINGIDDLINSSINSISIYPTSTEKIINLDYNLASSTDVSLRLIDVLGKVQNEQSCTHCFAGQQHTSFDISKLPNGIYFIQLQTNSGVLVRKFVKR